MSKPPLILLYSTAYRYWEKTIKNQLELINELTDTPLFGIHYWKNISIPEIPPSELDKYPYKHSISSQTSELIKEANKLKDARPLWYTVYSTKIALENAENLYKELYGKNIPDDHLILRLRSDILVSNIKNFPKYINNINDWISTFHYLIYYGDSFKDLSYENKLYQISDSLCLTSYKTMKEFVNIDITKLCNKTNNVYNYMNAEILLYSILKEHHINPVIDTHITFYLQRDSYLIQMSYKLNENLLHEYEIINIPNNINIHCRNYLDSYISFKNDPFLYNNKALSLICLKYIIDINKNVIDIGANYGEHTISIAKNISGNVYSYETDRLKFMQLCTNILLNRLSNVYPIQDHLDDLDITNIGLIKITIYDNIITIVSYLTNILEHAKYPPIVFYTKCSNELTEFLHNYYDIYPLEDIADYYLAYKKNCQPKPWWVRSDITHLV
jgi:hypothetical protein